MHWTGRLEVVVLQVRAATRPGNPENSGKVLGDDVFLAKGLGKVLELSN